MTDDALYTARVDNSGGTSGHVRVHDGPILPCPDTADTASGSHTAGSGLVGSDLAGSDSAKSGPTGSDVVLPTGAPTPSGSGFNPEQFLAMAWATCLGETLRVVLRERRLPHESSVSVEVELHRDPAGGYRFVPRARVTIEQMAADEAREIAAAAHARCPVSKLLTGQGEPVLEIVDVADATDTSRATDAPAATGATGATDVPGATDRPDAGDAPETPETPEAPSTPGAAHTPEPT
ncbi:OsmC family protein [Brachybacterium alimentarium]|uniref:OsmC family protein n=1 Tax=Brachybacterium alimentarium TaxID=47845 RepID=UPI003FD35D35